jgi:UDP-N-acetylmuramate-alanine ligase
MKAAVSAHDLVGAIRDLGASSEGGGGVTDLPNVMGSLHRPGDLVMVLGAGDIDKALEGILARM